MKAMQTRRSFLKELGAAALAGATATAIAQNRQAPLTKCGVVAHKEPAAIAMWDFSWALRHDPGCEFADWDKVLDGLVERGYNAIRFDVFPPLVATGLDGRVNDSHHFPKSGKKPVMWGNQFPTTLHPRQALKEFIPRCLDRGLLLGLSTWFFGPGNDPKRANQLVENVQGLNGFVRVWDETLRFLKDNDLLHNIYYVDLLNEYPLFSGFKWLRGQMDGDIEARGEGEDRRRPRMEGEGRQLQQRGLAQVLHRLRQRRHHPLAGEVAGLGFPVFAHL
jgi:hypothetical protein